MLSMGLVGKKGDREKLKRSSYHLILELFTQMVSREKKNRAHKSVKVNLALFSKLTCLTAQTLAALLFHSGGRNHKSELLVFYALELARFVSAFNVA